MQALAAGTYTMFIKSVFALAICLPRNDAEVDPAAVEIISSDDDEGMYRCRGIGAIGRQFIGVVRVDTEVSSASVRIELIDGRNATHHPYRWSRWVKRDDKIVRFD